jgi:hypothetical protein
MTGGSAVVVQPPANNLQVQDSLPTVKKNSVASSDQDCSYIAVNICKTNSLSPLSLVEGWAQLRNRISAPFAMQGMADTLTLAQN